MKRWIIRRKQILLRTGACLLCGCVCYAAVSKTLPIFSPFLERMASLASSLAVNKKGAANSIPTWSEVEQFGQSAKLI